MFSGLNKFLKIILPKRLFYRALIIVAAPTIILQLIITIVFYDSIWIKANKKQRATLNPAQDFWCYPGQVLLVSTPRSREQLYNGQFVTVVSVSAHLVRVRGTQLVSLSHAMAGTILRPSHSITYASCQGLTFANQIVRLLDVRHHCFTGRHLLVGLSRASSASLVEVGL